MPCFVIHWHAYFPTGLFYLLPGPCLPCPKFDVSGYQFIPTWNKEKIMVRDKQHHTQKHHQNPTFKHTTSSPIRFAFSHVPHFSLHTILQTSISHCSPVFLFHLLHRHGMCHRNYAEHHEFSVCPPKSCSSLQAEAPPWPAAVPSMISHRRTSHAGADTRSGVLWFCFQLLQVLFVPLDPCGEEWLLLRRSCAARA